MTSLETAKLVPVILIDDVSGKPCTWDHYLIPSDHCASCGEQATKLDIQEEKKLYKVMVYETCGAYRVLGECLFNTLEEATKHQKYLNHRCRNILGRYTQLNHISVYTCTEIPKDGEDN